MREFIISDEKPVSLQSGSIKGNLSDSILDNINALVCIIDLKPLKIIWANKYLLHKLGYSIVELNNFSSEALTNLIHPDFHINLDDEIIQSLSDKSKEKHSIFRIKTKDGRWLGTIFSISSFEINEEDMQLLIYGIDFELEEALNQLHILEDSNYESYRIEIARLLTCRQLMVLKHISKGKTDKEIADILSISIHTAKTHRKKIIHKLGFRNTGTLINFAIENHLG